MAHNHNLVLALYKFSKRLCLDTRLDTGILLHLLRLAAVVSNLVFDLYHRLVAASSKRQIHRASCVLHTVHIRAATRTNTDTQCNRHLIADIDGLDILQKTELVFPNLCQCLLLHHHKEAVLLKLSDNPIICIEIFINLSLNQRNQKRSADFLDVL